MSYACIRQGEHQGEDKGDQRNNICRGERVGDRDRGQGLGFRRIRQCTGVTLLTVNTSPREHFTVYMIASIIADNISLSNRAGNHRCS